jgi:hypothetical protein
MYKFERIELYYSSSVEPAEESPCDLAEALKEMEKLASGGVDAKAINVEDLRDVFRAYHKATMGPDLEHKSIFSETGSAHYEESFGRTIPALLCYAKANDRSPSAVFPKREKGRLITVNEALERILQEKGLK